MVRCSDERNVQIADAGNGIRNPDLDVPAVEDRTLFDVQFQKTAHRGGVARASQCFTGIEPLFLHGICKGDPVGVTGIFEPLARHLSGNGLGTEHTAKPAFLL